MPGDFSPRREELARLQESPILSMGPEPETAGAELRFSLLSFTDYPGAGTLDTRHTKSLIYNISLMAGQTRGYGAAVRERTNELR
jgi:hypothetical protein